MGFKASIALTLLLAATNGKCNGIQSLNRTLGGRVQMPEPFALPCFSEYNGQPYQRDDALCKERQTNYGSASYRVQFPGAYMIEQSGQCANDKDSKKQCLLNLQNPADATAYTGVNCDQGNLPDYYVEIKQAQDAVEIFKFAAKTGQKLSIKNSGHNYLSDASGRGSLNMWTRNLKSTSYNNHFVPQGCPRSKSYRSITIGAGIDCQEAYTYADSVGSTILCGYAPTVGLSGGYVQGGGHSTLSNTLGLAADRVVQFTVVTPDGKIRVANECQNSDLFWAMRGGGGGTWGLVIDSTHKVETALQIGTANITIPKTNNETLYQFFDLLVDTAVDLAEDGWGGHIYGNYIVYTTPKLTTVADATKSMQKLVDFANSNGGTANITVAPTWMSFFNDYILNGAQPVGTLFLINTRLVPKAIFTDETKADALKTFIRDFYDLHGLPYFPVTSPYLYKPVPGATSFTDAWYDSIWEIGYNSAWAWNSTYDDRVNVIKDLTSKTEYLESLTPGGGAYQNEANPFTEDWQESWWGEHYPGLLKVKHKYDPKGLLSCWKCVGWSEKDLDQSCYAGMMEWTT